MKVVLSLMLLALGAGALESQARYSGPIVDVNVRARPVTEARRREFEQNRVTHAVVFGPDSLIAAWSRQWSGHVIPSITLPCPLRNCYPGGGELPDTAWVRAELQSGRARGIGELMQQFSGMEPVDPRLEPYFALAEQFDVPVSIHLSLAPPNATRTSPQFRTYLGRPQLLEDVLVRHPKLRVIVAHAGYPLAEEMIALLFMYPNVSVDISAIALPRFVPAAGFHAYLRRFIELGFHDRILFGSDVEAPTSTRETIEAIESASFLTLDQKRAIFCGNAQKLFRIAELRCE